MLSAHPRWMLVGSLMTLGLVASVWPAAAAQAQQGATLPLAPGTRVRVTSANLVAPLVANFLQMRGDTAVFIEDAAGRGIWSIQVAEITKLERSDGERFRNRPDMLRGAAFGAAGGAVGGMIFSAAVNPPSASKKWNRPLNAGVGAVIGAAIGAAFGSRTGAERWTDVPVPRRLSIVPESNGVGVRVSFAFRGL